MGTHCTGIFRRAEILSTGLSQRKNVARSPLIPMTEFLVDNTEFHFQGCLLGLTIRAFSTAGRMGKPVFPCPRFSLPLFHSHIYFFFLPAGFLQAFNQGQYVLNQHFSFFMQHCPLKLFAAGWRLNCCQYPLRAPPRRAHIGHLLRALQVSRRQLGLECISGSAYQAVAALRGSSFQEPDPQVVRRSTGGQQAEGMQL